MNAKNYTPIDHLIKKSQPAISTPKEAEPAFSSEKIKIQEVVEHQPQPDVRPHVQVREDTIKLPPDLEKLGLRPVSSTKFPSYQPLTLPISDEKIVQGLHAPIYSSLRWLATLALYLLKKAHLTLKVIHGHVVRVLKP